MYTIMISILSNSALIASILGGVTGLVALIINFIKYNKHKTDNQQSRVIRWLERKLKDTDGDLKSLTIEHDLLEKKYYDQVRLVTLLESNSFMVPFSYWLKNINFEIDYVNRYYEQEFNTPLSTIIGKTDYEIFPKEVADKFRENDKRVLEGSKDVVIDVDNEKDSYLVIKWKRYVNNLVVGVAALAIKLDDTNKVRLTNLIKEINEK